MEITYSFSQRKNDLTIHLTAKKFIKVPPNNKKQLFTIRQDINPMIDSTFTEIIKIFKETSTHRLNYIEKIITT